VLLASLVQNAADLGARRVTLEVRVSNDVAQALYRKYGFQLAGTRRRYYSDNNEDAYIMTTGDIQGKAYRDTFHSLVDTLSRRLNSSPGMEVLAPAFGQPVAEEAE
jgi:ribosomal-protein-alanine N-acetyltransferase